MICWLPTLGWWWRLVKLARATGLRSPDDARRLEWRCGVRAVEGKL